MSIYYFTPFNKDGNFGDEINKYCRLVPSEEDYICILDGDCMFLTHNFGKQLEDIVEKYKNDNIGLFTCLVNRTGTLRQCFNGVISEDPNIRNHRNIAIQLQKERYDQVVELKEFISGHLMLFKKKTWEFVGYFADSVSERMQVKGINKNILGVDNRFSRRILKNGYKIYLMTGVYLFHYYRLNEGIQSKDHLK